MKLSHIMDRFIQKVLYLSMFFLPFREPLIYHHLEDAPLILKQRKKTRIFIVTDKNLYEQDFFKKLINLFKTEGISFTVFHETLPNPSIQQIEEIFEAYQTFGADCILAVGGGSVIDASKGVGIRLTHPNKSLQKMKGILKVWKKQPLLIAVPTTAGTGSEATVACVVTDLKTHEKYAINDPVIIPKIAILDPICTEKLPKHIVSTTGMDALTHAVEAYIGKSNTFKTKRMALSAMKLIRQNLLVAYQENTYESRVNMLLASYQAGVAFTRAYVGNVHALAHQLGGMYHTPHGLANAVLLPKVLRYYGKTVEKKLASLSDYLSLTEETLTRQGKAQAFISWIESLNTLMNIPSKIDQTIQDDEKKLMSIRAYKEANPLYPVPMIFELSDFETLYSLISK
ncbi:MAG: iron-containing alcohol dehydrogenase [Candidatus Izemoplasmatales bacterium]